MVVIGCLEHCCSDELKLLLRQVKPFGLRHPIGFEASMKKALDLPGIVDPDHVNRPGLCADLQLLLSSTPVVGDAYLVQPGIEVPDHIEDSV